MVVPDFRMVAEVLLMGHGFKTASSLAEKVVTALRMCCEHLSHQDHYDFGMRTVQCIINATVRGEREDEAIVKALRSIITPILLKDDFLLFENILKDLFTVQQREVLQDEHIDLIKSLRVACDALKIQPSHLEKCV
jgi:hypothetical protein